MDALSLQSVQINRQRFHQCLAFTGFHFSDSALVEHNTAYNLYRIMLFAQHTPSRLTAGSKSLRQDIIQRLTSGQSALQLICVGPQFRVAELLICFVQRQNLVSNGIDLFQFPLGVCSKNFVQ